MDPWGEQQDDEVTSSVFDDSEWKGDDVVTDTITTPSSATSTDNMEPSHQEEDDVFRSSVNEPGRKVADLEDNRTQKAAPPNSLTLSGSRPGNKKRLAAPALSLTLGRSDSAISEDFLNAALSPSPDDEENDLGMSIDLDGMETPSDSESLHFPPNDLDMEGEGLRVRLGVQRVRVRDDLRRLGVSTRRSRLHRSSSGFGSRPETEQASLGSLEQDQVDSQGTRWRCFSTREPLEDCKVNMTVLEPYLRVLSHGGYYGDGMNDIIVFSSCHLPENNMENYNYIMDNLFRYVIGTMELMVTDSYVIIYLCAAAPRNKLPSMGWLRDCYTTIDRRLRKNLESFYVVHPTWYIKALITVIKPFISSKFSRKLQFISSLEELTQHIPTEHVQIPNAVRLFDKTLTR
ncbi:BCL2/adenovirus E1B 19 kDa protein-interacting protein 2-like [Aplochiton taeniatus]